MNVQNRAGIICCLPQLTPGILSIWTPSCFYSSHSLQKDLCMKAKQYTESVSKWIQRATRRATGRQCIEAALIEDCFLLLGEERENISKTRMCNKVRLRNVSHSWRPLKTEVEDFPPFTHQMSKHSVLQKEQGRGGKVKGSKKGCSSQPTNKLPKVLLLHPWAKSQSNPCSISRHRGQGRVPASQECKYSIRHIHTFPLRQSLKSLTTAPSSVMPLPS